MICDMLSWSYDDFLISSAIRIVLWDALIECSTCLNVTSTTIMAASSDSSAPRPQIPFVDSYSERQDQSSQLRKLAEEAELKTIKGLLAEQKVRRLKQQNRNSASTSEKGLKIRTDQSYTTVQTDNIIRALAGDTMDNLMRDNVPFDSSIKIIDAVAADARRNGAHVELEYVPLAADKGKVPSNSHLSLARLNLDGHALVFSGVGGTPDAANEVAASRLARSLHQICSSNRWV